MQRAKLTYFDIRGRAEAIRIFLAAVGAEFEDRRVVSPAEWTALESTLPFGVLPMWEMGDLRLWESHAILRHLARVYCPRHSDAERANLDVAHEFLAESQEDLWRFNWVADYYEHLESYADSTLKPRLERLERWLGRDRTTPCEWFGPSFSPVDTLGFCFLDEIDAFFPVVLAEYPQLAGFRARVAEIPEIATYLTSETRPSVFGIGSRGPKLDPRIQLRSGSTFANPWSEAVDLSTVARGQRRLTGR